MKAFFFTHRFWLTLLGFVVALGLLFWFGARLIWKSNLGLMNRLQELAADQEILRSQADRLSELRLQDEIIHASRDRLTVVVAKEDIVNLIERIEQLAAETNVTVVIESTNGVSQQLQMLKKAKPKATESKEAGEDSEPSAPSAQKTDTPETIVEKLPTDQYVEVTLKVTGEYAPLRLFLEKLEVMPYYVGVIDMHLAEIDPEKLKAAQADLLPPPGAAGTQAPVLTPPPATDRFELRLRTLLYETGS